MTTHHMNRLKLMANRAHDDNQIKLLLEAEKQIQDFYQAMAPLAEQGRYGGDYAGPLSEQARQILQHQGITTNQAQGITAKEALQAQRVTTNEALPDGSVSLRGPRGPAEVMKEAGYPVAGPPPGLEFWHCRWG